MVSSVLTPKKEGFLYAQAEIMTMNYTHKIAFYNRWYVSLIFFIFLLLGGAHQIFALEVVLNSAVSVIVPEEQSGNPGDYVTYILELNNRGIKDLNLQVEYVSEHRWNIIGDIAVNLPAHTNKQYFPVTVFIPQNTPAGFEEKVRVRFKLDGETFFLPEVPLPVRVNEVSAINFIPPAPVKGVYGSTVAYEIMISNNGNTDEQFTVQYRSANSLEVQVEPDAFILKSGEVKLVRVALQIPGYTSLTSEQVELTFKWGREQKIMNLTTFFVDKLDSLSSQYYIWQGYINLGHPNLTEMNSEDFSGEIALNGEWGPDQAANFYSSNHTWFSDIKYNQWNLKMGKFPFPWPGLMNSQIGQASLNLTHQDGDRYFAVSRWDSADDFPERSIWGAEAAVDTHSTFRYLYDPVQYDSQSVFEWYFQENLKPTVFWSNSLAMNSEDPTSFGGSFQFASEQKAWQWNTNLQYIQNFYNILNRTSLWTAIGLPPSDDRVNGYLQIKYESKELEEGIEGTNIYNDYQVETFANLSPDLRLYLSRSFHYLNDLLQSDNSSVNLSIYKESGRFNHQGVISYSEDDDIADGSSNYSSFDWYTAYQLSKANELILNPHYDSDNTTTGFGFKWRGAFGSEFSTMFYPYLRPDSKYNMQINLRWPFYQYQLIFKYSGIWEAGVYTTDLCSLVLNKRFSFPVKKPLGTITGHLFIDKNHNGIQDGDDPVVSNLSLLLDGKTSFQSDAQGSFSIGGIAPGEHTITLDSRYNVIYTTVGPEARIALKPYQTITYNLPLIRTRNITGTFYQDQNGNNSFDTNESGLAGVPVILKNILTNEESRTFTDYNGNFVFYQLAPNNYQITVDLQDLPEGWQPSKDFQAIPIDANMLEEQEAIAVGFVPYEKPVEIIALPTTALSLKTDRELVFPGEKLKIIVEAGAVLKKVSLLLPDGSVIQLAPGKTYWLYEWKIPAAMNIGPTRIICTGQTQTGDTVTEECNLIILQQ
jgi:hypothetical protein